MPFRGLDLTGGGAGSASGSRNLLVNQRSFLSISLICLSVLPSTGTPSCARVPSSRQPPVSLQKLKHLRTRVQGAGEPTAQHFVWNPGTTGRPSLGSVCWVQALPDLAWLGFQGSFLPLSSPQSPPGHMYLPPTTTSRDLPGHSQRTCSLTSPARPGSKMLFPSASG